LHANVAAAARTSVFAPPNLSVEEREMTNRSEGGERADDVSTIPSAK